MVNVAGSRPLVGRGRELRSLGNLAETAKRGRASFLVVEGEPGIGKTAFLDRACELAKQAGFTVRRGQGEELDRERPFGLVADALGLPAAAMEAPASAATSADLRFQVIERICELAEERAETSPLALAADDVHWADPSSLLALYRLSRRLAHLPFLLLLTCRPLPRRPELTRLVAVLVEQGGVRLTLQLLSRAELVEVAAHVAGVEVGPTLERELLRTGGNPLFARELVQALLEEGALEIHDGTGELTRRPDPSPSLRLTILRRMTFLGDETLELLKLASVLGESFSLDELATVGGRAPAAVLGPLRQATDGGIVSDVDGRLAFRHDLVREALYLDLLPAVRKSLHLQAGRALATAGAPARRVAVHLSLGAEHGDAEAVAWLKRAGQELASQAPSVTIELLERALELAPRDDAIRTELSVALIRPLVWTGSLARAEAVARERLAEGADPEVSARLRLTLASLFFLQYRLPELEQLCVETLALSELAPAERGHFLALAVMPAIARGDLDRALVLAGDAARAGRNVGSIFAVPAENTGGIVARLQGRFREAVEFGGRAVEAARVAVARDRDLGLSPRQILGNAHVFQSWNLLAADRLEEASSSLHAAMAEYEQIGAVAYVNLCHRGLAQAAFLAGRWDDARAELEIASQLEDETQSQGLDTHQADPSLILALHQGRLEQARCALDRLEQTLPPEQWRRGNLWFLPTKAAVLVAGGDDEAALEALEDQCRRAHEIGVLPDYRLFGRCLVRLALTRGRRDLAEHATAGAVELSRRAGRLATTEGNALLCCGLLEDDPESIAAAVAAYREGPRPLHFAAACEDAGEIYARRGRRDDAVAVLSEALEIYRGVDGSRDAARVTSRLRTLGANTGARGSRKRASVGWASLTPAEQRVARLVAEGLSNPEIGGRLFISRRTVSTHLAHIFRKLGISSRTQLAVIAAHEEGVT